jgi:hypothetical protein
LFANLFAKPQERIHNTMQSLKDFQSVALENGFVEAGESEGGSALWFRNSTPDAGSQVHQRLCLDRLTNSATIFWETVPVKLNSLTFRTASALRAWLSLNIGNTTSDRALPIVRS